MEKTNVIRRLFTLFFLFSCIFGFSCSDDNPLDSRNFSAEEPFSFNISLANQSLFQLEGIAGRIIITGESGANSIQIIGKKRVDSHSTEDAQQRLQDLEIDVQNFDSKIHVRTIQPQDTEGKNYIVDYTVTLPENLEVSALNISGTIDVNSNRSVVRVNNVSGDVHLNDIHGNVFVDVVSGRILGDITLPLDGTINLNAVSGAVELSIPQNTSAEFSATVVSGNISISNITLKDIIKTQTSLRGTCGEGRGTISLSAVSGNIAVSGI